MRVLPHTTAGERLVEAAHVLGLCESGACTHYLRDGDDLILSPAGHAAANAFLNAFYGFEVEA